MVITPNIPNLPYAERNGVKYFSLVAEPVKSEILPGIYMNAWGYNGSSPGPTICVYPGDYVCIRVFNKLPQPTSVHWHGLDIPNVMDGVPDIEPSPRIDPGGYFDYHFKINNPPGTHMYHSHFYPVFQDMMGLEGGFMILDPQESEKDVQRDYYIMLGSFKLKDIPAGVLERGVYNIDPFSETANFFTMNGRCFPYTAPLPVSEGDRIRIRFGNVGMANHPIHLHGHQFLETAVDGNSIARENQLKKSTILVSSGTTRDIELIANNPGRWPLHCHFPHHVSNNMTLPLGGMATAMVYEGFPKI
ncbi:copper oxidase [Paenibacillus protaetiae]|uniref:Copper oxidase n=2 Tax=Paenibacillus protaetiae TaxID=2509456 RepID=A0A4P6EZG5_9BACL|nr:copper oxidase [Paenibacillus protaetiae]QAY68542.1 copper oxidase [Paenibacillus protaetiae]